MFQKAPPALRPAGLFCISLYDRQHQPTTLDLHPDPDGKPDLPQSLSNGESKEKESQEESREILFNYDGYRLLGEYDISGHSIQETVWLGSLPVATVQGGGVYLIHSDHLGTPRVITCGDNTAVWAWESDPFGEALANEDPDGAGESFAYKLRFSGQYYDAETGKHYNYFREYDPSVGRYIEPDLIGVDSGLNTYIYVTGNPVNLYDLYGMEPGDKFKTVNDALIDINSFARTINPKFVEHGGWIYPVDGCITYNVTTSMMPGMITWEDMMKVRPNEPLATWHTHGFRGRSSPDLLENYLSGVPGGNQQDTGFSEATGVPNYLVAPVGWVYGYNPDTDSYTDKIEGVEACGCEE